MKRYLLLVAGIAALTTAAYCGAALWAQPALGGGVAPAAGTKIGVVNVGTVFTKYEKAKAFKDELQTAIKPFKDKADGWRKDMIQYQDAITNNTFKIDGKTYSKESLEKGILDRKRALEDMDREVRNLVGKKQEDQLVQLWKEVTSHIRAYGASKGFHMVFGYGDPMDAKELDTFANINRKMQGMDLGAVCPLYVANGLDISEDVVVSLNAALQQSRPAAPAVGGAGGLVPKGN